ncbi:MAG: hypothetical protein NXI30_00930 [bacterium]|nr:hypothetical protein [bacterium]
MGDPDSLFSILWPSDGTGQQALWVVLGAAALAAITVYGPLAVRLVRLFLLERRLRDQTRDAGQGRPPGDAGDPLRDAMADSPLADAFAEFDRRWSTAQLGEAGGRAPIRLIDVFEDKPLLPFGPRRSLLPTLPGIFLGLGVFGALAGLIPSLSSLAADEAGADAQSAWLAMQLGQALRVTAWGFLCGLGASLTGRLLEGGFNARAVALDEVVERAYGSVSPGELAEITRQTQQRSLETLGKELGQFGNELNERLDRGLQRIEQSTSRAASLVSQEQRGALHTVVQELSLSVRQGVEHHLAELRNALQRATEHQGTVTSGLAETFERMVENAQTQDRIARTLIESASAVEEAARTMHGTAGEMQPVLDHLGSTSRSLSNTADRMGDTQQVVARTAEGVRTSLEHAAEGVEEQRQFVERSLSEIRRALVGLGDGLGDSLQRSLREVDDVLGLTVGQLRDTLAESNETIDRLAGPIRAAEGSTRETHVALDRVRNEVEALGQWMNQAIKPLRTGVGDVEARAEDIARAIGEFTSHTRQIDKTMDALRQEIHEESRRLQGAGGDLGRRLTQATDAVALLETATSEAARKARPKDIVAGAPRERESGVARERNWSPAPPSDPARETEPPRDTSRAVRPPREPEPLANEPTTPAFAAAEASEEPHESTGRDLALSGYRMGTPRAQGPDPYARFDDAESEPQSNVRHFPTPDRELGEDLKLSGLLGTSAKDRDDEADDEEEKD